MNDPIRITHRVETTFEVEGPAGLAALAFPFAAAASILGNTKTAPDLQPDPLLEWSPTLGAGKTVSFEKAEAAITKLNASLPHGEPQWRMPTRRELESIQDLTKHDPCVDLERYPDTKSGYYWSSTPCAWSSDYAWVVGFDYGVSGSGHRGYDGAFVRAVRAVPSGQ